MKSRAWVPLVALFFLVSHVAPVRSWSNGGYSADPNNPDYGTHDWLAHHALDWVPDNLDFWIRTNLAIYLYGTELPDNGNAILGDGIGDSTLHHVYYRSNGQLQDDASAKRARQACDQALSYLTVKDYRSAAKWMGIASHYICDLAVFAHVMGKTTDWGDEKHHSDYENWVNDRTNRYDSQFTAYLNFDGKLETISAYDATLRLASDTTFDSTGKGRTAKWMDDNYNPTNQAYQGRIGESLNLAVNLLVDIIYSVSQTSQATTTTTTATGTSLSSSTTITATTSYTSSSNVPTTTTTRASPTLATSYSRTTTATTSQTQSTAPSVSTTPAQQRRCIIATAAYGSQLAPQVQALRAIRDSQLMNTFAGSQFMRTFNHFYYSFSPTIADAIELNPTFADATRIVLTPLIQILGLLRVTGVSEIEVILGGLAATALIGVVYLTLPLFLIGRLRLIERLQPAVELSQDAWQVKNRRS